MVTHALVQATAARQTVWLPLKQSPHVYRHIHHAARVLIRIYTVHGDQGDEQRFARLCGAAIQRRRPGFCLLIVASICCLVFVNSAASKLSFGKAVLYSAVSTLVERPSSA
jgi:hypothetical protein